MHDKITIADAPDCLNTNDKAMWVLDYQAAIKARRPCLLQIQEPPTKTEALAHYSQQAILAMDEAAPAAVAVPTKLPTGDEIRAIARSVSTSSSDSPSPSEYVMAGYRAALAATTAADAPLYAEMLAALQSVGMDAVGVGGGENTISDSARAKVEAVLEKIGAPWPSSDTAAAAPVVLPEPFALYDGEKWYANEEAAICSCADMAKLQKVYLEQQLSALLAGVSAPAAQAVELPTVQLIGIKDGIETDLGLVPMPPTVEARELLRDVGFEGLDDEDGDGAYAMGACEQLIEYCQAYYGTQAQAVARDAELLRFLQDQCIDLRCFTTSDGEDVGWRTVQHHMSEPRERVVSEVYGDQPRRAIREAMARIERRPGSARG